MAKIEDFSLSELKAYAYDLIINREQIGNILQQVNNLIVKKSQVEKPVNKEKNLNKKI